MIETRLRAALISWLEADPALALEINSFTEEAPVRTAAPWLGIVASASADWSVKDRRGREVRLAVELNLRGDATLVGSSVAAAVEDRIEAMPHTQDGFEIASIQFLRARAEQRPANLRAILLEYRFRLLEA